MKRKILTLTLVVVLLVALTVLLSGCSKSNDPIEGKNVVTFVINGGILSYGTASTNDSINYAYHPGTYVKDPTLFNNYKISRNGYNFTGWYTSPECNPNEKWDFNTPLDVEKLTLYAGWELAIKHTYSVNYVDGESIVSLGSYSVSAGDKFNDRRKFADTREGYTAYGYYADPECTIPWDTATTHPGGAADLDIPVYVNYIEGTWNIVSSFDELKKAVSGNVYLVADIDCGGQEFYVSSAFDKIFEGNGFKVSNFTAPKKGTSRNPSCAIFEKLESGAVIRNVSFENVKYSFILDEKYLENATANVAALALELEPGVTIADVSVSGVLETNFGGDLSKLEDVFYKTRYEGVDLLDGVTGFTAEIVVNKQ